MDKRQLSQWLLLASCLTSTYAYSNEAVTTYGPTKAKETLWSVAETIRPDESVNTYQVVWALFENNPKAFGLKHDPDNLLKDVKLNVPSVATMKQTSPEEAKLAVNKARRVVDGELVVEEPKKKDGLQIGVVKPATPLTEQDIKNVSAAPQVAENTPKVVEQEVQEQELQKQQEVAEQEIQEQETQEPAAHSVAVQEEIESIEPAKAEKVAEPIYQDTQKPDPALLEGSADIAAMDAETIPTPTETEIQKQVEHDIAAANENVPVVSQSEDEKAVDVVQVTTQSTKMSDVKLPDPLQPVIEPTETKSNTLKNIAPQPSVDEQKMMKLQESVQQSAKAVEELQDDPIFGEPLKGYQEELQAVVKEFPTAPTATSTSTSN